MGWFTVYNNAGAALHYGTILIIYKIRASSKHSNIGQVLLTVEE